jgi:DNA-binding NarL/FixJ family response regulator
MRIVIAEDAAILRDGMTALLTMRGHDVVAVGDGPALFAQIEQRQPDVAVVDIRMPPSYTDEGLRAALKLRKAYPDLGVLLFSQHVEVRYAAELLDGLADRVGYLLKERVADIDDFLEALERIAHGGMALDPEVVAQLLGATRRREPLNRLSPREREVLALMAEGRSNAAIAAALVVSERAVEKHVTTILTKLDLPPSETDHRRVLAVLRYLNL